MKALLSVIRWKFVAPVGIFIAATLVFFIVFFDPIAGRVLEKVASRVNGAKVEVSGFKTKFFQGRLSIAHLNVTNKSEPMQNIVEMGPLAFQLDPSELFGKRVIINEATLSGLQFNTARKTSGALPKIAKEEKKAQEESKTPSAAAKLAEKYKERFKFNVEGIKGDVKAKIQFDVKDLEITKQGEALKEKGQALPAQWNKRVDDLNVEGRLKKVEEDLKSVKNTPTQGVEAITAVPASLKKLKESKEELSRIANDVKAAKESVAAEARDIKAGVGSLSQAKQKDVDGLLSRLNLDFADPDRLMEGLIGPMVLERFQTAFKYVEMARQHMPSKKVKDSLPPKPREHGMDIEFPTPAALPRFWLVKAGLDGNYQGVKATGAMTDLTSDPSRVGKPFKMDLKGQQGSQNFVLLAVLDHVGDISKDSMNLLVTGLDAKSLGGGGFLAETLSAGEGAAEVLFSVIGESNIGGQIGLSLSKLKFDDAALMKASGIRDAANMSAADGFKAGFVRNLARGIEAMPLLSVNAQLFGTWSDPSLKISSNLGGVLTGVIKDSVGNAIRDQKKQLEAQLDQVLKDKTGEVNAKLAGLQDQANARLGGLEAQVQQKINEATGINLSSGESSSPVPGVKVPSLDKLFKR